MRHISLLCSRHLALGDRGVPDGLKMMLSLVGEVPETSVSCEVVAIEISVRSS